MTHSVVITGFRKDRIALDAAAASANSVKDKSRCDIIYLPNALVAKSVTMLLMTKAAMTMASPIEE